MITEGRLAEISALPDQRDNAIQDDIDENYRVGKLMSEAIRELLQERRLIVLQNGELKATLLDASRLLALFMLKGLKPEDVREFMPRAEAAAR